MSCYQHLNSLTRHGISNVARLRDDTEGHFNPPQPNTAASSRQRLAALLQQARRQLRQMPEHAPELRPTIATLQADIFPLDPLFHAAAQAANSSPRKQP